MLELPEMLYGDALERGKSLAAPAVLACAGTRERTATTLTIDGRTGRVTSVTFYDSDHIAPAVQACVRRAFRDVIFDRFARPEMQVTFTFLRDEPPVGASR